MCIFTIDKPEWACQAQRLKAILRKYCKSLMGVVRCDMDPDKFLVWKHPVISPTYGSTIIVNESQAGLLFNSGRLLAELPPGPHLLESTAIPGISNLFQDNSKSVPIEVWFFNKIASTNFRWGTQSPVEIRDIEYNMLLPVGGYGSYQIRISDPQAFILSVVGIRDSFSVDQARQFLYPFVETNVKTAIAEASMQSSAFTISSRITDIADIIKLRLSDYFSRFGLVLDEFFFQNISILSDDPSFEQVKQALAEAAKISIKSRAIYQNSEAYQIERRFDVLEKMAENSHGMMSELAGLGVGIGAAAGLAQSLGSTLSTNVSGPPVKNADSLKERLVAAKDMLDKGIIEQSEFDIIKERVLRELLQ
jgi:membrane protease subunit (stomatin/prohibitin family)